MEITAQTVKELRDRTGAGIMDCRKALTDAQGDLHRAEAILKEKGMRGPKDPTRVTRQGLIHAYIHPGGQRGSLVELNCETDFVARTEEFKELAREIAMHVAASEPQYLDRDAIPESEFAARRVEFEEQLRLADADPTSAGVDARVESYVKEVALLEQPYVRDPKTSVRQLILGVTAKTGENIRVGRFAHYKIGG